MVVVSPACLPIAVRQRRTKTVDYSHWMATLDLHGHTHSLTRLAIICALTAAPPILAQTFPTGAFSAEFKNGTTGTLDISGPVNGNYTVKLTVGGITSTQVMRVRDGSLVGVDPLILIQHSSTSGNCVTLGLATSTGLTGSAKKGC